MFIDSYVFLFLVVVFFFKQKTAYEMRISDWSSDVCSSDLSRDRDRRLYRCAIHRDDAPRRSAGRRAALSRDALRLLRVDDRRGRAGDQSLSVEPGPGPRADAADHLRLAVQPRSEEHTSELQSLMRISYAVFCLKQKNTTSQQQNTN